MIRKYNFEWYLKKDVKYGGNPLLRHTVIKIGNPTGQTNVDAKTATDMFCRAIGNLNKIEITKIKECDENGQIGEDIVPQAESAIIPVGK